MPANAKTYTGTHKASKKTLFTSLSASSLGVSITWSSWTNCAASSSVISEWMSLRMLQSLWRSSHTAYCDTPAQKRPSLLVFFSPLWGFWGKIWQFTPHLRFQKKFRGVLSGYQLVHTNSTLYARSGPQWFCELRCLWPSVPWWVACAVCSHIMPGQNGQPTLTSVTGVCILRCDLPPTLLAEWPWSFTCRCSNTGWNGHWIRVSAES